MNESCTHIVGAVVESGSFSAICDEGTGTPIRDVNITYE